MVPDPILQDAKLSSTPKTMFEKVWDDHVVVPETADTPAVLFIDLHLTHEVTTPQAYTELRARGLKLRRPDLTLALGPFVHHPYLVSRRTPGGVAAWGLAASPWRP